MANIADFKTVTEVTPLTEDAIYAVIATDKYDRTCTWVKGAGLTYDDAAAYCERNNSPDNPEKYHVGVER